MTRLLMTPKMLGLKGPNARRMIRNARQILKALGNLDNAWNRFVLAWDEDKSLLEPEESLRRHGRKALHSINAWPFDEPARTK